MSDLTVAMLAKALISSGADSIHVRPGQVPQLTHGLNTRQMSDVAAPAGEDVRRLCSALLPEAKLAEIEHGKRKRLRCHLGQLGPFVVEIGASEGLFSLVLAPVVGEAELEAALGASAQTARKTQPRIPVVESSAHLLVDPPLMTPLSDEVQPVRPTRPMAVIQSVVDMAPPPGPSPTERRPRRRTAILLALFLGEFGVHHFYLGRRLAGWLTLVLLIATGGFAAILLGAIAFRDAFRMWRMSDEAFEHEMG